ncbi:MAG: hypothetical protein ABJF50_06385 [Paracoccaceae bacterium]
MMKLRGLVLGVLLVAPMTAQAASCRDQWSSVNDMLVNSGALETGLPGLVREGVNDTCRISGVEIPTRDGHVSVATKTITWSGTDMERFVNDGLPPTALSLSIEGISVRPEFGDKALSYLNEVQSRGRTVDLALSANWDFESRALTLAAFNLEFPQEDHIRLSADVEGVDLTSASTIQLSVGSATLTRFSADIRSLRMFQDYFLQPLGLALLNDSEDPAAKVLELKDTAKTQIGFVPDSILPTASKEAFLQIVDAMPELSGSLALNATAEPGLGAARFIPLAMSVGRKSPQQIWEVFEGVRIDATFDPF